MLETKRGEGGLLRTKTLFPLSGLLYGSLLSLPRPPPPDLSMACQAQLPDDEVFSIERLMREVGILEKGCVLSVP